MKSQRHFLTFEHTRYRDRFRSKKEDLSTENQLCVVRSLESMLAQLQGLPDFQLPPEYLERRSRDIKDNFSLYESGLQRRRLSKDETWLKQKDGRRSVAVSRFDSILISRYFGDAFNEFFPDGSYDLQYISGTLEDAKKLASQDHAIALSYLVWHSNHDRVEGVGHMFHAGFADNEILDWSDPANTTDHYMTVQLAHRGELDQAIRNYPQHLRTWNIIAAKRTGAPR